MGLFDFINKKVQKMKWYDISLLKLTVVFATLFVLTVWSGLRNFIISFEWFWYAEITAILMVPLLYRFFLTDDKEEE